MIEESISIEELWNKLLSEGVEPHKYNNYEVLDCNNVECSVSKTAAKLGSSAILENGLGIDKIALIV